MPKASDLLKVAPKYLGIPYSTMDCQAFVERCLKDIGIDENLPGSNAWYRRMTWVGTPEECKRSFGKIPEGAFLFILKQDGKEPEKYRSDGIGNASHIGIYTGMGYKQLCELGGVSPDIRYDFGDGAINSSSTHACVCTSKFQGKAISGGWNRIGLWDQLIYEFEFPAGDTYTGDDEEMTPAIVEASSGATVNFRSKPSLSAPLVDQIPIGDAVTVGDKQGEWYPATWHGKKGYIMAKYIILGPFDPSEMQDSTITVSREKLEKIYQEIGELLKV